MSTAAWFDPAYPLPEQASVVAQQHYRLRAVSCDQPLLVIPLQGHKRLREGSHWLDCAPGHFIMLHQAQQIDVENLPPSDGPYRALALSFAWPLVAITRSLLKRQLPPGEAHPLSHGPLHALEPALQHYLNCNPADQALVDHAAIGLLLALASNGHDAFLRAGDPSLAARVRVLLGAAPAREWKSADLEAAFCVSSATLRRRLQEEQTSFRALLQDVRLHHALYLLQTRRQALKSVAKACGYGSLASFSHAFAARFGLPPSAVVRA